MKSGKNKFVEELDNCVLENPSNCCKTEANEPASKKHDIIILIESNNLELNKESKKKVKKKNLKKIGKTHLYKREFKKRKKKNNKKPKIQYHITPIKNKSISHINNNNSITSNKIKQKIFFITKNPKKKKNSQNKTIFETNNNINSINNNNNNININNNSNDICILSNNSINVYNSNFINSSMNFIYNNNLNDNIEEYELNFLRKKRYFEAFDFYEEVRNMERRLNNIYNYQFY